MAGINAAVKDFPEFNGLGIVDLNKKAGTSEVPAAVATAGESVARGSGGAACEGLPVAACTPPHPPTPNPWAVRNHGGGHYNHSLFWKLMCNPSSTGGPGGALKATIEADFGSVDSMKDQFNKVAAGERERGRSND